METKTVTKSPFQPLSPPCLTNLDYVTIFRKKFGHRMDLVKLSRHHISHSHQARRNLLRLLQSFFPVFHGQTEETLPCNKLNTT